MKRLVTDGPGIIYERLFDLAMEMFPDGRGSVDIAALAEAANLKYDGVYSIVIRKKLNANARTLRQLAGALDCSVDYLLGASDNRTPPIEKLPDLVRQLAGVAKHLSSARQRDLLVMAKTYAETSEESTRQFFSDVKDMLIRAADESGRGEELDNFLALLDEAERKNLQLPSSDEGALGTRGSLEGTEEPSKK